MKQNLSLTQKTAKERAATELKGIISNVTNREYSNYKKEKHVKDAKYVFYKYDTKFSFEQNSKEQVYTGTAEKDYNKIAKMYMQDYLMGKTKLSDDDTAVIDRKSANKYTNPGKKQQKFYKKMKLTPELKNVLEIAQKNSTLEPIKDNSKYQNWEYYKFDF